MPKAKRIRNCPHFPGYDAFTKRAIKYIAQKEKGDICPKCGSNNTANAFEGQADLLPFERRCLNCFHKWAQ